MVAFRLAEKDIWPGCREIEVEGELDLAVSDRLRSALARATAERHHVLLDLSGCQFVDASVLAVLVQAHRRLRQHDRQLLLCGVRGQVRRLLALTAMAETGLLVTTAAPSAPPVLWGERPGASPQAGERSPEASSTDPDRGGSGPVRLARQRLGRSSVEL
jgi:anti-anti-sigma factor